MTYAAACTERVRLGCAVFVTPLHQPVHLAKSLASLDQLSRGRLDVGVGIGGPIMRDRVWFFGNLRSIGIAQVVPANIAPNANLGDNSIWHYTPEPGVESRFAETKLDISGQLTGQLTPRNPRLRFDDACKIL